MFGLGVLILAIFSLSHDPTPDRVYAGYLALGWGLPAALIVAGAALSERRISDRPMAQPSPSGGCIILDLFDSFTRVPRSFTRVARS